MKIYFNLDVLRYIIAKRSFELSRDLFWCTTRLKIGLYVGHATHATKISFWLVGEATQVLCQDWVSQKVFRIGEASNRQ